MKINRIYSDRELAWLGAWHAAAGKAMTTWADATKWADACLVEFDNRFPDQPVSPIEPAIIPRQEPLTRY